eukprot:1153165-Pelagomonas_calceolata.AAC.3
MTGMVGLKKEAQERACPDIQAKQPYKLQSRPKLCSSHTAITSLMQHHCRSCDKHSYATDGLVHRMSKQGRCGQTDASTAIGWQPKQVAPELALPAMGLMYWMSKQGRCGQTEANNLHRLHLSWQFQ